MRWQILGSSTLVEVVGDRRTSAIDSREKKQQETKKPMVIDLVGLDMEERFRDLSHVLRPRDLAGVEAVVGVKESRSAWW